MRRLHVWCCALVALSVTACGETPELPRVDLDVQVSVNVLEVAPGESFEVEVTRLWRKDLLPADFDAAALRPLSLVALATERVEDGTRVQERRRFRGYVFAREDIVVPSYVFEAGQGNESRKVTAPPVRIRVAPEVMADEPGAPEHPQAPAPATAPRLVWPWVLGVLGLALAWIVWRRARREPPAADVVEVEEVAPRRTPEEEARLALDAIDVSDDDAGAFEAAVRIEGVLRAWLAAARVPQAHHRSVEELAEQLGGLGDQLLAAAAPAQQGKFADRPPLVAAVRAARARALALVEAAKVEA